jgi:2-dehydropantoate 2-reductase
MEKLRPLSVLVFGAGAIGTYVGGSLILAGHRVVFVEQESAVSTMKEKGLRLDLENDKTRNMHKPNIIPPSAFDIVNSPKAAIDIGPYDVAIFAMKSFDTQRALDEINPIKDYMPPIFCLQNGVDNENAIRSVLGEDHVIPGTITGSVTRKGVGDIVLEKKRGIGITSGKRVSEDLFKAMDSAGLNPKLFRNAGDMKWSKLLMNLPGSATSAIVDMTPAEVYSHPGLYAMELRMAHEALSVMKAQGVRAVNLPKIPIGAFAFVMNMPALLARPILKKVVGGGRGGKMPSFHIDLHAGRKNSEVSYLHGAVVRYGEISGIPTPVTRLLTTTLLSMVNGEIPISAYSRKPDKLIGLLK